MAPEIESTRKPGIVLGQSGPCSLLCDSECTAGPSGTVSSGPPPPPPLPSGHLWALASFPALVTGAPLAPTHCRMPAMLWPGRKVPCRMAENSSHQGQNPCLAGKEVLIQNLKSGFSANLMLFLWLHNNIVLVAKKPPFNTEHWVECL